MRNAATIQDTKPGKGNVSYIEVFDGPGDVARELAEEKAEALTVEQADLIAKGGSVKLHERIVRVDGMRISVYILIVREPRK